MLKSEAKSEAEEIVSTIKAMLNANDPLIYETDWEVKRPNVISPSTAGAWDLWLTVTAYNAGTPDEILTSKGWQRMGSLDVDVHRHDGSHYNSYNPTLEITTRLD